MKKIISFLIIVFVFGTSFSQTKNFHDFTATDIDGKQVSMKEFAGRKILVVNVASECGLTPQYEQLQAIYELYGGDKFVIIGFPANNFLKQEPGSNAEIKQFCTSKFHVTFPMMSKISVKDENIDPIYLWLTQKSENSKMDSEVKWNFQKYLIDEQGNLVDVVSPRDKPDCEKILNWITEK